MSISVSNNHLSVKANKVLTAFNVECYDIKNYQWNYEYSELRAVIMAVVDVNYLTFPPLNLTDEFIFKTAQRWRMNLKANGVEIPLGYEFYGTKLSKAISQTLLNPDYFEINVFEDDTEKSRLQCLEAFDEAIIEAYQVKDFLNYCEDGDYECCCE